jgi:mRNA interferase MazF
MDILFGHIYLVNFDPSIGKEYRKVRPALVIQSHTITSDLVTVMPISSKTEKRSADDIPLSRDDRNRLLHDSVLKVRQISSFDKRRFIHRIGESDEKTTDEVAKYLRRHFNL